MFLPSLLSPNSERNFIKPCDATGKIQFQNRFTNLSLEITHMSSLISFDKKLVFTLQIGDHFFFNLNSVLKDDCQVVVSSTQQI